MSEVEGLDEDAQSTTNKSPKSNASSIDLNHKLSKRKNENDSSEELNDDCAKKSKNDLDTDSTTTSASLHDLSRKGDADTPTPTHQFNTRHTKFDSKTKFILGKSLNDIYFKIQQQLNELNSSMSSIGSDDLSSNLNLITIGENTSNAKSIYTKFPNLFRYEADQYDRHWLNENQIIKRKNIKSYLLILDEIDELFRLNFNKLYDQSESTTSSSTMVDSENEKNNDEFSFDNKESIFKKLKPFTLPDFILYKLKRQYLYQK